jgi:hypothetical protein
MSGGLDHPTSEGFSPNGQHCAHNRTLVLFSAAAQFLSLSGITDATLQ